MASICENGACGHVDSIIHSCDIWTTHYTGLTPEQHGVNFLRLLAAKEPADLSKVKTDLFLWDWLNRHGLRTGFVEPLHAYPAPPVDGFFVAGQPRPQLFESDRCVYPPALAPLVDREYLAGIPKPPSLRDLGINRPFSEVRAEELLQVLQAGYFNDFPERVRPHLDWYTDLILRLYEQRPVDVLWVYFLETDIIGHFAYHESPPETLVRSYAEVDRVMAKLIDRLAPEGVVVISDHGMISIADLLQREQVSASMQYLQWEYQQTLHRAVAPDIVVVEGANRGLCTGTHADVAFYAASAPGIPAGTRANIHFHDVFRMILRCAGVPAPEGRPGRLPPIFTEFSQRRATEYDNLQWVSNDGYLMAFLQFAELEPTHSVLEIGVGTGQVAARGRELVQRYVGLDNSLEMLSIANQRVPGLPLMPTDARQIPADQKTFDRVLARSVLHHMTDGLEKTIAESLRVLKPGGQLIIGEGIPPSPASVAHFTEVFELKEERLVLLPENLVRMLEQAGFVDIRFDTYVMPQVSIRNWLEQTDLSQALKEKLLKMHRTTPPAVQRDYRTTITADDVRVDFTFALVSGRRP